MIWMPLIFKTLGWFVILIVGFTILVTTMYRPWGKSKAFWPLFIGGTLLILISIAGISLHLYMNGLVEEHDGTVINKSYPVQETPIEADADTIKKLLELKKIIDMCQTERALYKTVFEQCRASKVIPKDRIAQMCGMINEDPKIKKILYLPNFKGSNLSNAQFDEGTCREGSVGPYCEIGE